jgi:ATP-dependent helicase/nuclease subunit A
MIDFLQNILTPHQLSALQYKNHISLTANAGSGKTFVLSKRYLEIALNENIQLRNIAAITFTDKAASELYKKIASEVEQRLNLQPDEKLRKKLEKIRRQLVSANISTIHSFCIDILKEYPVEASLDANFQPIDESLSNELVELSIEETIKSAFDNQEEGEDLKYLIRVFASKKIFAEELFSLIKNRKNVFDLA